MKYTSLLLLTLWATSQIFADGIELKEKSRNTLKLPLDLGAAWSMNYLYQSIPSIDTSVTATMAGPQVFMAYRFKPYATLYSGLAFQSLYSQTIKAKSVSSEVTQGFYPFDILIFYTIGDNSFSYGLGGGFSLFNASTRKVRGVEEEGSSFTDLLLSMSFFVKRKFISDTNIFFQYVIKMNLTPGSNVNFTDLFELHNTFHLGVSYSIYGI